MLEHGGNIDVASQKYNIEPADWLDLSTGINPNGWPVPDSLPNSVWSALPIQNDGLLAAAQHYYQCNNLLAVAGSQAAIQSLPHLRKHCRVGVLTPAYAEHAHAWQQAGHTVIEVDSSTIDEIIVDLDVLIIINPNNPTTQLFSPIQLLAWHKQLSLNNGWLIVDEAFMDVTPEYSVLDHCPLEGLIVLRSIGKFFGLAGLRVGFVFSSPLLLNGLADLLGPWPIAQASRHISQLALSDSEWQQHQRWSLSQSSQRLNELLTRYNLPPTGQCSLFQWVCTPMAASYHQQLAQHGILTRLFTRPSSLRFGLPNSEDDWRRLAQTLETITIS
jgi:cobalamin biosynthetic protein CobC